MIYPFLPREDVGRVIEGKGSAPRIPKLLQLWVIPETFEDGQRQALTDILSQYPDDFLAIRANKPTMFDGGADDAEYRWMNIDDPYKGKTVGLDEKVVVPDWRQLDGILEKWPNPNYPSMFNVNPQADERYRLCVWWYCLFEMHWQFRGMANALMDYYTDPSQVHRLYEALTGFYLRMMERAKAELGSDGIFFSDDIGMQTGSFFSLAMFREFFKPYYQRLIDRAHKLGMHFWLHTCGNVEIFIPEFIEIGLDVLHPIQKYTMDERRIAREFGKDICIWAGFDVQRTIPWGSTEEVRREVRFILDTFNRPEGRLILGAGNAINGDCPLPSLAALFDEVFNYRTGKNL
jgi:uroporphyrinogen decarboxylase